MLLLFDNQGLIPNMLDELEKVFPIERANISKSLLPILNSINFDRPDVEVYNEKKLSGCINVFMDIHGICTNAYAGDPWEDH